MIDLRDIVISYGIKAPTKIDDVITLLRFHFKELIPRMKINDEGIYIDEKDEPLLRKCVQIVISIATDDNDTKFKMYIDTYGNKVPKTVRMVQDHIGDQKILPWMVDFIKTICEYGKEFDRFNKEDISNILSRFEMSVSKDEFAKMFNNAGDGKTRLQRIQRHGQGLAAYSVKQVSELATIVFNKDVITEEEMIEKALDDPLFAKMWLFVAASFTCAWRKTDVITQWSYLNLENDPKLLSDLPRDPDRLKDMLLNGAISRDTFRKAGKYMIDDIIYKIKQAHKTEEYDPVKLRAAVCDELLPFFGMLLLIIETHQIRTKNGYMDVSERPRYSQMFYLKKFFSKDIEKTLERKGFSMTRMTKSILQAEQQYAIEHGESPYTAYALAAYARCHKRLSSTRFYLQDNGYSNEDAEFVAYQMIQRPVFSAVITKLFALVLPDDLKELSQEEQTQLMITLSPDSYQVENTYMIELASSELQDSYKKNDKEGVGRILKSLLEISMRNYESKTEGVQCTRRAFGLACCKPEADNCIKACCPYCAFTEDGIRALIDTMREYKEEGVKRNGEKYLAVLQKIMIPMYTGAIDAAAAALPQFEQDINYTSRLILRGKSNE